MSIFRLEVNKILPLACSWVAEQETRILEDGVSLSKKFFDYATRVGVRHPEKIRILLVSTVPVPEDPVLRDACRETQIITNDTIGLALNYGIFIHKDYEGNCKTYVHEFTHIAQYESLGSIHSFLQKYIYEVLEFGYQTAPMEREAVDNSEEICT